MYCLKCNLPFQSIILPGHWSVTGTNRNDFFPSCFLAPGFLSGQNRRIPIGSYRFQKGPAGDRLESYRNCPKTSDRNPAAKNQSKTAQKRSEAAKTGWIRHGNRRNRPAFWGSGNWIDRPGMLRNSSIMSSSIEYSRGLWFDRICTLNIGSWWSINVHMLEIRQNNVVWPREANRTQESLVILPQASLQVVNRTRLNLC